jgi:hypothetical protein
VRAEDVAVTVGDAMVADVDGDDVCSGQLAFMTSNNGESSFQTRDSKIWFSIPCRC